MPSRRSTPSGVVAGGTSSPQARTSPEQLRVIAAVRSRLFGGAAHVRIGRYRLVRQLGVGGMGEVYLAEDPELGRRVAVKQVRVELGSSAQRARLVSEARALARLSHPNVVQIHEVGEHEGETYLAMEYVEGTSLLRWLDEPRLWTQVLALFVAAGRGIEAAHGCGLVHRDFKPANVLLGDDGRPRVADFGLALAPAPTRGPVAQPEVAGTIRYMSLEQLRGEAIDARTDQFSFCVALYEALWGQLPFFPTSDLSVRIAHLEADSPRPPRWSMRVPRRLWTAIRRGLRRDPSQRWPGMGALLDEIERLPQLRQRRLAAGVLLPLITGIGLATGLTDTDTSCRDVATELDDVWSSTRKAELEAAFARSPAAHASDSFPRARRNLDAWRQRWIAARVQQCESAISAGDDVALARGRRACLERQRRGLETLVVGLSEGGPAALERAVAATASLPDPQACAAAALLEGPLPPANGLDEIEDLRLALASSASSRLLGRADLAKANELLERARSSGYGPVEAEALAERGRSEIAAGSAAKGLHDLDVAAKLALASGHRRLLAEVWTTLALHRLTDFPDLRAGRELLELAEAAWFDRTATTDDRARLALAQGWAEPEPELAAIAFRRALDLDPAGPVTPRALAALAALAAGSEALDLRERALAAAEEVFGPHHPATARHAYNLGALHHGRGDFAIAEPLFVRAVDLWSAAHETREHADLARAHLLLADMSLRAGDLDTAEAHAHKVASVQAATLPVGHADFGDAPMLLGRISALRGEREQALAHIREALARYEAADGPGDDRVVALRLDLAGRELSLGQSASAAETYTQVLAIDPAPPRAALAHIGLAELALREGRLEKSREHLAAVERLGLDVLGHQLASFEIVRALVELRAGCRRCRAGLRARVEAAMIAGEWPLELLEPWLEELELSRSERQSLGLARPSHAEG